MSPYDPKQFLVACCGSLALSYHNNLIFLMVAGINDMMAKLYIYFSMLDSSVAFIYSPSHKHYSIDKLNEGHIADLSAIIGYTTSWLERQD